MIDAVKDSGSTTIRTRLPSGFFARTKKAVGMISMSVKPASLYLSLLHLRCILLRFRTCQLIAV
jgi:hypothetical protein